MPIPSLYATAQVGIGVTLGGLAFNQGAVDENGVEFYVLDVSGWDSPDLRTSIDERPLAHGAYRGTSYYGARQVDLSVLLYAAAGRDGLAQARDRLVYETDLTDIDALLTIDDRPALQALVRRAGRVLITKEGELAILAEIALTAVDPRRYGVEERQVAVSPAMTGQASNEGSFRGGAPVVVTFTGPSTNPAVTIGGQTLALTGVPQVGTTPTGQPIGRTVTVDTLEGTVLFEDGTSAYGLLAPESDLPVIPARSVVPVTYRGTGGGATVRYRAAYL